MPLGQQLKQFAEAPTLPALEVRARASIIELREGRRSKDAAFAELTLWLATPFTNFLRRVYSVVSLTEAEDLYDEFILTFYKKEALYESDKPLLPYLWRMARNLKLNYLTKRQAQERLNGRFREVEEKLANGSDDGRASRAVEATVRANEILNSLSQRDADIAWLHWGCGYTMEEVANDVGLPSATVRSRLNSVRRKFERKEQSHE